MAETPDLHHEWKIYFDYRSWLIDRGCDGMYLLVGIRADGEEHIELFETYESAIRGGHARFGMKPFLLKQITRNEP